MENTINENGKQIDEDIKTNVNQGQDDSMHSPEEETKNVDRINEYKRFDPKIQQQFEMGLDKKLEELLRD